MKPEQPPRFAPGTRVGEGGKYEIRRRIGIGGMAEVYKAFNTLLGNRAVAIKVLSASVAAHPYADKMRKLFIQEAYALSKVKDDNVVDVLDVGALDDGTPYMVMEFLEGSDLGARLKGRERLGIEEAVGIMSGLCAGVYACHLAGIIHRDLKPANIFLAQTAKGEQPKVLDFSVAKVPITRAPEESEQTKTDLIVGTPTYMSPEQAVGKPANELSDQYSIGALLYRCLIGRSPQGILQKPRDARPDIPEELERVILRAMDPSPKKRFASVHELGSHLQPFASETARARWRSYYHAEPKPFDPTTGSISGVFPGDREPDEPASSAETEVAAPYDFAAHDRTTRVSVEDLSRAGSQDATDLDSSPAGAERPTSRVMAPTTVDVPVRPTQDAELRQTPEPSHAQHLSSVAAAPTPLRARRKILAAFGLAAAIVVVATIGAIRLAGGRSELAAPDPPVWTRAAGDVTPAASAPTSPSVAPPPAARAASPSPAPAVPGSSATPSVTAVPTSTANAEAAVLPAPAPKHRKRKRIAPPPDTAIQYGGDEMPIIR